MATKKTWTEEAYPIHCLPINQLRANLNNPRVIQDAEFQKLVQSIKTDGFMLSIRFIVVDKDNVVLGGNQRFRACQEAGLKEVHVVRAEDLSEEQLKEFVVKDNTYFGEFDRELVAANYSDRELVELGVDLVEVCSPRLEVMGDIEPEIDSADLARQKEIYDNNSIKQVVVYYPAELYEKVVQSLSAVKTHSATEENPDMLVKLIRYWRENAR